MCIRVDRLSKRYRIYDGAGGFGQTGTNIFSRNRGREHWCLRDISFDIKKGSSVAIVGPNGSGKSTLLKIIAGVLKPTMGGVQVTGRLTSILELGAGFHPNFSGRDNVSFLQAINGLSREEIAATLPAIEAFADIGDAIDQPVRMYSSGMFVRLAFAAAVYPVPDILIIDEALAVGDILFQRKCFERLRTLRQHGTTTLMVSHNPEAVTNLCDEAILLRGGAIVDRGAPVMVMDHYIHDDREAFGIRAPEGDGDGQTTDQEPVRPMTAEHDGLNAAFAGGRAVSPCPFVNEDEAVFASADCSMLDCLVLVDGQIPDGFQRIPSGAVLDIYASADLPEDIDGVKLGFALRTRQGTYVYGTNGDLRASCIQAWSLPGRRVWRFQLDMSLAAGTYVLDIGCYISTAGQPKRLAVRLRWLQFEISEADNFGGLVNLIPRAQMRHHDLGD